MEFHAAMLHRVNYYAELFDLQRMDDLCDDYPMTILRNIFRVKVGKLEKYEENDFIYRNRLYIKYRIIT